MAGDTETTKRTAAATKFWSAVKVEPVEIALNSGVGLTLRAYRMDDEITPADVSGRDRRRRDAAAPVAVTTDEEIRGVRRRGARRRRARPPSSRTTTTTRSRREDEDDEDEDEDEASRTRRPEEVPVFLTHAGKLLLFQRRGLVEFVRSGAGNDLTQLDTWTKLVDGVRAGTSCPAGRGLVRARPRRGEPARRPRRWDPTLLIEAGEVARDLAYALRIAGVLALSPGSRWTTSTRRCAPRSTAGSAAFMARRTAARKSGHRPQVWAGARLSARSLRLWTGATDPLPGSISPWHTTCVPGGGRRRGARARVLRSGLGGTSRPTGAAGSTADVRRRRRRGPAAATSARSATTRPATPSSARCSPSGPAARAASPSPPTATTTR